MSQNLQNYVKFQKIQLENLVDFEKCCKTHFLAKNGADTAENEQQFAEILPKTGNYPTGPPGRRRRRVLTGRWHLGDRERPGLYPPDPQTQPCEIRKIFAPYRVLRMSDVV